VPAAVAGRLADLLRNVREDERVRARSDEFRAWMLESSRTAERLENDIVAGAPPLELTARLATLDRSCRDCHVRYRDR